MTPEDELRLSFYEEISAIKQSHNIFLVRRIDTGEIFIKKTYDNYPSDVFDVLNNNRFQGIPKIYECITDREAGKTVVIEEYINGQSLDTILDREGCLEENRVISIVVSLCNILAPLHRNDPPLIHRDIKPSNVIIGDNDEVHLVDFDASRLYNKSLKRDTELLGTEAYAAPEQYGFLQSDPRTDIYALGVLMREMITGSAYKGNCSCGNLDRIINKCTCMDPEDRYQNTLELKQELITLITPVAKHEESSINTWFLPGFRGHNILIKMLAVLMYLFVIYVSFSYSADGMSPADLWVNRIALFIALLSLVLLYGNYMDIQHTLPLINSNKSIVRILGYITYTIVILFVFALVASLADILL